MKSLEGFRAYERSVWFPGVGDASRFEAYVRDQVVIQADGSVRPIMSETATQALVKTLITNRRDYTKVQSPALAIYAETMADTRSAEPAVRADVLARGQKYMASFRTASIERVRRELSSVEIVNVRGTHMDFLFTSREKVVAAMRRFLGGSAPQK
jgi:hypothetical protein